ncbi:MAG: hypothetical protein O9264_16260 [Leptospira sp.]|nr:hypothetical protein [Leptospira sp.]
MSEVKKNERKSHPQERDDFYPVVIPVVDTTIEEDGLPKDFAKMLELHLLAAGHDLKTSRNEESMKFDLNQILQNEIILMKDCLQKKEKSYSLENVSQFQKDQTETGGVYIFWWIGSKDKLETMDRTFYYSGIKGKMHSIQLQMNWFPDHLTDRLPLYIGKTATSFRKRIGLHLLLNSPKRKGKANSGFVSKKYNSSCQLRHGLEILFKEEENILDLIRDNIGLTLIPYPGEKHIPDRFYLENYLIGSLRPWFNLDSER